MGPPLSVGVPSPRASSMSPSQAGGRGNQLAAGSETYGLPSACRRLSSTAERCPSSWQRWRSSRCLVPSCCSCRVRFSPACASNSPAVCGAVGSLLRLSGARRAVSPFVAVAVTAALRMLRSKLPHPSSPRPRQRRRRQACRWPRGARARRGRRCTRGGRPSPAARA